MKKVAVFSTLLAVLNLSLTASVLAYYAPLQEVSGPTVEQNTVTKVTVSVKNTATGMNIPFTWTIDGGAGAITVDQIFNSQGIVAWRVKDEIDNKFKIVWGVYDPGWAALQGQPLLGWQITETDKIDETNILLLSDGLLLFETKYTTTGGQTNITDHFWAYDPSGSYENNQNKWILFGWRGFTYSFINGTTSNHILKDGVAALIYDVPNDMGGRSIKVIYAVYDGRNHWWINDETFAFEPTALQITNATVTWIDATNSQKCGYDYTDQTWKLNQNTKVMSCYAFWPTPVKVGQWVYFTDMSLAADTWNWNLGDNSTSTARSLYHKYLKAGAYYARQEVIGLAGSDFNSQSVPVKLPFIAAISRLLLEAN